MISALNSSQFIWIKILRRKWEQKKSYIFQVQEHIIYVQERRALTAVKLVAEESIVFLFLILHDF